MSEKRVFSEVRQGSVFEVGVPINNVYVTTDYSIFQFSKFNRNILLRKEIIEQAKEGILSPIIVNENFMVIDGQHRLKASEQVGVPVEYIVKKGLNEHDIVRMNTVQKPWTLANFIEAFANQGKEEYVLLLNLINEKHADTTSIVQISNNSASAGGATRKSIENGNFKFFNYEKTVEFLTWYEEFRKRTSTPKRNKVATSLWEIFKIEAIDLDRLISKTVQNVEFNDLLKTSTLNQSDLTKRFIDTYNSNLSRKNPLIIDYVISSKGTVLIKNNKSDWALLGK